MTKPVFSCTGAAFGVNFFTTKPGCETNNGTWAESNRVPDDEANNQGADRQLRRRSLCSIIRLGNLEALRGAGTRKRAGQGGRWATE